MTRPFLSIGRIERRLTKGGTEGLEFKPGVNVLVGPPNTGKTKWLQTLDFLLGDPGDNPFEGAEETGLAEKYDQASAELSIGDDSARIERRWREPGAKTKVFVDGDSMTARDLQHWLMSKLEIPVLNFPKGNPMSGQTWPELSFRMLLRHIYRQQRFWGDIADKQPEGEQHACVLQFLGLAELLFTEDYGRLIGLKMKSERLRVRREQYADVLEEVASEVLRERGLTVGITTATVRSAEERVANEIEGLRKHRIAALSRARDAALSPNSRSRTTELGEKRAAMLVRLEGLRGQGKAASERLQELRRYRAELAEELDRLTRAEDAGVVLADLTITHCPACDQPVLEIESVVSQCFLCHQSLPDEPMLEELGSVRLRFELDRLSGELTEADELIETISRDVSRIEKQVAFAEEDLRALENELAPARHAVGALVQQEVSGIDMALGEMSERQRQIARVAVAVGSADRLTDQIASVEKEIEVLQRRVDEAARVLDFDAAVAQLEDGMNAYLSAINELKPGVWHHSPVSVDVSRANLVMRVGSRRWHQVLGGTDTLYFLMAYHYGLLSLSEKTGRHYPGLSIIDVPGEFAGEEVKDKENFIVQPFIDLLKRKEYEGAQLIITGASFAGLKGVHRRELRHIFAA